MKIYRNSFSSSTIIEFEPCFRQINISDFSFFIKLNSKNGKVDKTIYEFGEYEKEITKLVI